MVAMHYSYGGANRAAREEWDSFFRMYMPPESLSAREYLRQLQSQGYEFHQPLARELYDPHYNASETEGSHWVSETRVRTSLLN